MSTDRHIFRVLVTPLPYAEWPYWWILYV